MANTYNILADYFRGTSYQEDTVYDSISVSPYWCLAIVRQKYPFTFSRQNKKSFRQDIKTAIETKELLILTDECLELRVSSSKTNHITSLFAGLLETKDNLLVNINPGDYVFAWIVNNKNDFTTLLQKIQENKECNDFMDGLKFSGKVNSIRKILTQQPGGERLARYTLQANAFEEFDTTLYYEPTLAQDFPGLATFYTGMNLSLTDIVSEAYDNSQKAFSAQKTIMQLLETLFGRGAKKNLGRGGEDPRTRATYGKDTEGLAAIMPSQVGSFFGISSSVYNNENIVNYADILQTILGIQEYDELLVDQGNIPALMYPNVKNRQKAFFEEATYELNGALDVSMLSLKLTNNTVWSILDSILNKSINEMYTCFKSGSDKKIRPTLVVRQIPFTTEASRARFDNLNIKYTGFLDLPRWKIHPLMVKLVDIGKSNAVRFNYVNLFGKTSASQSEPSASSQMVQNGPAFDELDIVRHGFRPWNPTVNTWLAELRTEQFKQYIDLIADFMMGQYMTFNGIINMVGIQAPICPGDNIEWDGGVFHVEGLTHSCRIEQDGRKHFETSLAVTNGVRSVVDVSVPDENNDLKIYLGIKAADVTEHNPGQTKDSEPLDDTEKK